MSNTPKLADECVKLLDNGRVILLFKNDMGSYTAAAFVDGSGFAESVANVTDDQVTGDFTPSQALYRLTEKVTTGRIVGCDEEKT